MVAPVADNPLVLHAGGLGGLLVEADGGGGEAEDLDDRRAERAPILAGDAADVVRGDAALLVGRAGQRRELERACDGVGDRDGVAHGVDVGVAGAHVAVDHDGALGPELEPGGLRQLALRHDADGEDDEGAVNALAALDVDADAVFNLLIALDRVLKAQVDAVFAKLGVELAGHIPVQRRHDLLAALEYRHAHARLGEVLRGLEADEAAAYDDDAARLLLRDDAAHLQRVLDGAQLEHALRVYARGVRHHGLRAGREDELVVLEAVFAAVGEAFDRDALVFAVYRRDLARDAHVDIEAGFEAPRGLEREGFLLRNDAADVVGQAAVGVGDEAGALYDGYLRALVEAAQPRRGGGPAGDAADDDYFLCHGVYLRVCEFCFKPAG